MSTRSTVGTVVLWLSVLALVFPVGGCSNSAPTGGSTSGTSGNTGMMGGAGPPDTGGTGMMGGSGTGATDYSSVGERIWLTGIGGDGQEVAHSAPRTSQGALMMGGGGCASCHGAEGTGGTVQMMMGPAIKVPNVTYSSLAAEGYADATIKRAIVDGLDEQGDLLDQAMPRWKMSSADVDAVLAYLKQLGAK